MDREEKDRLKRYGNLVVDFANGKNTDRILIDYLDNQQSAFNFTHNLKEEFLKRCPTKEMFLGKLRDKEFVLFEMLLKGNDVFRSCNDAFGNGNYDLEEYDPVRQMFTISERTYMGDNGDFETETFLIPKRDIIEYINDIDIPDHFKALLKADMEKLSELYDEIEKIKPKATKRFSEIEKMAEDYPAILKFHDQIREYQEMFRSVLLQITEKNNVFETKDFKRILLRYNALEKNRTVIVDNHKLIEVDLFTKDYSVGFSDTVFYCLIEFLKKPDNKKLLKKCLICDNFFIADSAAREVYCNNRQCKKDYDKYRKQFQREKEPEIYDARKSDEHDPAYERLKSYWENKPSKKSKKRKAVP